MIREPPARPDRRFALWKHPPTLGAVPPRRAMLRGLYIGRLSLAGGVFLAAALSWWRADLTQLLVASVSVTAALVVTAAGYWWSHVRSQEVGTTFLYSQALFDLALVTAVVHIFGPYSYFASLYILVIAFNTVLMPLANGLLMALLAGILYAADVLMVQSFDVSPALSLQIAVFWGVAIATGYLASRVQAAGAAQQTLEAELRRVRLEASDILRQIRSGILTVGGGGRLVFANPTAEALLGIRAAELQDRPVLDLLERISPPLAHAIRRTSADGVRVSRTEAEARVDGRAWPLGFTTTPAYAAPEEEPSVTVIFQDLSDAKRMEALHLRTERLEAVSEIAASLAHEIRNPLASIRSAVEQIARMSSGSADERTLAGLIVGESDRLSRLLSEFLDFSRVRVTRSAPVDLVAVAEQGIRLARQHPDCSPDAAIELEAAERPVLVEGDEDLLHRVVFNLVLNAVQAARAAPRVTVEVGVPASGDLPPSVVLEAPRLLVVRDEGPGVSAEVLPRLFEPFVTGRVGGTGLGLPIVQRAVQAHRGLIFCDTEAGRGTAFSVYLPARLGAEEAA
jgi:two-component system sensor histidine kinase PilS (NtrC family)